MAQARSDYIELQQVPRPVGNYILIKRGEVEDSTTAGGIILPDSSRRLDNSGEVIALGEQSRITKKGYKVPFEVKVGDYVYFSWFDATRKLKVKDEFYTISREASRYFYFIFFIKKPIKQKIKIGKRGLPLLYP